ncbi:MAG: RNB domain-containing ribonuclease [Treponema sp.]|nr:RNB domain-containing ribonuclease [Treponema sp.]
MIQEHALAVYKNKPALVQEITADKIVITLAGNAAGEKIKVREKDIEIIHPGPVQTFGSKHFQTIEVPDGAVREAWELLLADDTSAVSIKELAELVCGEFNPSSAWAVFCLLTDGLYFTGTVNAIRPCPQDQVEAGEKKREEKQRSSGERELFLERLRNRSLLLDPEKTGESSDDRRFMQDVEALALGKSAKSRTMKDMGLGETPEEAHTLLLECGIWTKEFNPHPSRFGISLLPAQQLTTKIPSTDISGQMVRQDLTHLTAFAIDSPWSHDPDDAISIEHADNGCILYVHIADPAASIGADSPAEREARDRGATLYLPEGSYRMLADESLPLFALGYDSGKALSPALTFKMSINTNGEIGETEIFPSTVSIIRLTYKEADRLMADMSTAADAGAAAGENVSARFGDSLRAIYSLAENNLIRRTASGAITIDMPEIHISIDNGQPVIEPMIQYRSADMVRECMLLAGEGAGNWAMQRNLPFPYIEQETGEMPDVILSGLAGAYRLRRCMRPRILSVKPGRHWGLGLTVYTQVTSPLRRYTDLLAHLQIRAFLRGGSPENIQSGGPLSAEEISVRMNAGEAAALAVTRAERASRNHWTMVYLSDKKDSVWEAVALEKKGSRWVMIIPALALETQISLRKDVTPNDTIGLILKSVHIPRGEAVFTAEE